MPDIYNDEPRPITSLGSLDGTWVFEITCARCRRYIKLPLDIVLARASPETRLYQVLERFRCDRLIGEQGSERCRGKPGRVVLHRLHVYGKSVTKRRSVVILGALG